VHVPPAARQPGPPPSGADPLARVAALPGVPEAAEGARASVDRLLAHRMLRRRSADISVEAGLRSARASAALEGADIPLDVLRTTGSDAPTLQDATLQGALRISAELGGLSDLFSRVPMQALARMHLLAAADIAPAETVGRPRLSGQPAEDGPGPDTLEANARLEGLVRLLGQPTSAPAVVVAAVLHAEILAVRPFVSANGLVARGAARLILLGRGLDPKALTAPDVGHLELADEYRTTAQGYVEGRPDQVAAFVQHCCRALELGARESLAVCEALMRG
jgi:Fic family protein